MALDLSNKTFLFSTVLLAAVAVHLSALRLDFMIDDPGIYAALSKNLMISGNYSDLILYGNDWLDKPHLPFWITAFFFRILGINTFAYLLPLTLAFLASLLYTFLFARDLYGIRVARSSLLILATAQYSFMATSEGRVEPYLMLFLIGSLYHFHQASSSDSSKWHLLPASLMTAFALMSKGPFILIPLFAALGAEWLFNRKKHKLALRYWIGAAVLTGIFVLPEIIALYVQFDSHPDKLIFGKTGVSGIRWFLWDSQFSRLVNSGPITREDGNILFYLHTLLWAFLPWALLLYYSYFRKFRKVVQKIRLPEYYSLAGSLAILILFSISKFQLPHYLTFVFPLFAMLTASVLHEAGSSRFRRFGTASQAVQVLLMITAAFILHYYLRPEKPATAIIFLIIGSTATLVLFLRMKEFATKLVIVSAVASITVNLYLSIGLYPILAGSRGDIQAADYINEHYPDRAISTLGYVSNRFEFYTDRPITKETTESLDIKAGQGDTLLVLTKEVELETWPGEHRKITSFEHYHSENMSGEFISKKTRSRAMERLWLLEVY